MGGFAFSRSESKPRKRWTRKLRERGRRRRGGSWERPSAMPFPRARSEWWGPLGRGVMKSGAGDRVVLEFPGGTEYLAVLEVGYERISVEPFREPPGSEASAKGPPRRCSPDEEETKRHR